MPTEFPPDLIDTLSKKLHELMDGSVAASHRYFHVQSINNFIIHLNAIKANSDKVWIYETLCDYFDNAKQYLPGIDRQTSKYLYDTYLNKIADYYASNLGFSVIVNKGLFVIAYFVLFTVAYTTIGVWISIGVVILFLLRSYSQYSKWKDRKVYSLFY